MHRDDSTFSLIEHDLRAALALELFVELGIVIAILAAMTSGTFAA